MNTTPRNENEIFESIATFMDSYYGQTGLEEYSNDIEVWNDYLDMCNAIVRQRFISEIDHVLSMDKNYVYEKVSEKLTDATIESPEYLTDYLQKMNTYFKSK